MRTEQLDTKLLLTVLLMGGWITTFVEVLPSWPVIAVGLLGIAAGGGLHRIARREAKLRCEMLRKTKVAAPDSGPRRPVPIPLPPRQKDGDLQQNQSSQPQQRWHRCGSRYRLIPSTAGRA